MIALIDRPHIQTDNERFGSGTTPPDEGGAWLVLFRTGTAGGHVSCVTSNRQAAEDAVYHKCAEGGWTPDDFALQVWTVLDTYPADEED